MDKKNILDTVSQNVNICSSPSELKITDIRVANINGMPKHCPLIKVYTNQGLVGCGEVRDASGATYAFMLKSRLIGENSCNVDKIFRRIKQFGGPLDFIEKTKEPNLTEDLTGHSNTSLPEREIRTIRNLLSEKMSFIFLTN